MSRIRIERGELKSHVSDIEKLNKITEFCRGPVFLEVNKHREFAELVKDGHPNQLIEDWLKDRLDGRLVLPKGLEAQEEDRIVEKMVKMGRTVELRAYPNTSITFQLVVHYDAGEAINKMFKILELDK